MSVKERFLNYVVVDTQSDGSSTTTPSTLKQFNLAKLLEKEMINMGMQDVTVSEGCIVYGTLPGNAEGPTIGFNSHMDTSPDMSGTNVKPRIIENYDGKDIILNEELGIVLSPANFPSLNDNIGETLIVTDGTTLLGADDKAGISEILEMCQYYLDHPEAKHPTIRVAFTPDEEIGRGTESFDIPYFNADFAYTVDGGEVDHIDFENFNAASAKVVIHGKGIHPGHAKGKMVNAILKGMEFQGLLPVFDNPAYTEGYEGFNHLAKIDGNVEEAVMYYIIRNHSRELLEKQKNDFVNAAEFMNKKYGYPIIELTLRDAYSNMRDYIEKDMTCVEVARQAMLNLGITPKSEGIRGGTDGAALTYRGLNCPNLGTGGYNYHGKYEYASLDRMETMVKILIEIVKYAVK